ncbi:angiotensin-converting enzyme-like [Ixodes scapularis]|uniref:angiotensin-converting enzyme-like n=1 Tax=Ixodes scapularis TaxID=6945 RepID=UPI001A9D0FBA|nr:angiotensin-converting enzyme-like [Ixodes scapularis]
MSISENYEERRYYWQQWRRVAVEPSRKQFLDLLQLLDVEAKLNGFNSTAEYWIYEYEWETFHGDLESLWELTKPLYEQLHAFLRNGLVQKYAAKYVSSQGPISAHLLGDLESESWFHETGVFWPPSYDTSAVDLKLHKMSVIDIFKLAESFYTSLGFPPLPPAFWNNSVLEESPAESNRICDASAWDFCDGRDFRIRMCTEKSLEGLKGVFHEMGHVYYFQQYAGLPHVFRQGANSGFHEAVADAMAWLACSPQRLHKIGLLDGINKELGESRIFESYTRWSFLHH